jgi:hypothetical protein
MTDYEVVDKVSRETGEHLDGTDAITALGPEGETVFVLEVVDE